MKTDSVLAVGLPPRSADFFTETILAVPALKACEAAAGTVLVEVWGGWLFKVVYSFGVSYAPALL